jgi:hypothetical protein
MSTEKNAYEALRWLRTGTDDLDVAIVLRKNKKFPHACFHAPNTLPQWPSGLDPGRPDLFDPVCFLHFCSGFTPGRGRGITELLTPGCRLL